MSAPFILTYMVFEENLPLGSQPVRSFLALRFPKHDESTLNQWIEQGLVRVNGATVLAEEPVYPGFFVQIILSDHIEEPADCNWHLLWENDELLAVYKPAMLPVSRTTRNLYNTLIQLVRRETPYYDAHLLHRLDTETSGVILIAKDKAADKYWKQQLNQLIIDKLYHAVVDGHPDWYSKTVSCQLSERQSSLIRSQMYVVDDNDSELYTKPQYSETRFTVLETQKNRSIIQCKLFTGRKHQIRAHLAHLNHPIIGDKIYSHQGHYYLKRIQSGLTIDDYQQLGAEHQQLMAYQLTLAIPGRDQPVVVTSPYKLSMD